MNERADGAGRAELTDRPTREKEKEIEKERSLGRGESCFPFIPFLSSILSGPIVKKLVATFLLLLLLLLLLFPSLFPAVRP